MRGKRLVIFGRLNERKREMLFEIQSRKDRDILKGLSV